MIHLILSIPHILLICNRQLGKVFMNKILHDRQNINIGGIFMKKYLLIFVFVATTFNFPLRCEKVFAQNLETGAVSAPVLSEI